MRSVSESHIYSRARRTTHTLDVSFRIACRHIVLSTVSEALAGTLKDNISTHLYSTISQTALVNT